MASSLLLFLGIQALCWLIGWSYLRLASDVTPAAKPAGDSHLLAIDGLRGILALSVFVYHAFCTRTHFVTGHWGAGLDRVANHLGDYAVTLFFFITGFLFWAKLQRDPRPNLWKHFRSRLTRLGPAYWATMAVVLLVVGVRTDWTLQSSLVQLAREIGAWLAFGWNQPDINGLNGTTFIVAGVVWTLCHEWEFYVLVPFCGWFAGKLWRAALFILLLILLRFGLEAIFRQPDGELVENRVLQAAYFLAFVFSGGIACAALRPWLIGIFPRVDFNRPVFSALGLGLVLATLLVSSEEYGLFEWSALLLAFLFIALGNEWFGLLTTQPALFLGKISYSIYLLHGIVLYIACLNANELRPIASLAGGYYWAGIAFLCLVVVLWSALWHRLFEAPFMSQKRVSARVAQAIPVASSESR